MSKRVVFFGSIPVARECLEILLAQDDIIVVGVCAAQLDDTWRTEQSVWEFCLEQSIPLIEHDQIPAHSPDFGLSVRYHKILKQETLEAFGEGVVNVHGGLLPEYRGSYCNIHAIINDEKEFGVTLHYLAAGVDTGDIVQRLSFPIEDSDTGMTLYEKGESCCVKIVEQNIRGLIDGRLERVSQQTLIDHGEPTHEYRRADLKALRAVDSDLLGSARTNRVIRAFDSRFHEPAFTIIRGEKVYLRSTW